MAPQTAGQQMLHMRIDRDFVYHPVLPGQQEMYLEIREGAREYAHRLVDLCPEGRELSMALSALELVVFHANAGVARTGHVVPVE